VHFEYIPRLKKTFEKRVHNDERRKPDFHELRRRRLVEERLVNVLCCLAGTRHPL